jgi:hypothetical protein
MGPSGENSDYVSGYSDYVNTKRDWAPTDFNLASMYCQSLVWFLPFGNDMAFLQHGVGAAILGGWEVSGAFSVPVGGVQGNMGYYTDQGPGFFAINMDLSRTIKLTARFKLMIRTEWLNAFNNPQFGNPNTNVPSSSFGFISSATGNRTIDLVGKLIF